MSQIPRARRIVLGVASGLLIALVVLGPASARFAVKQAERAAGSGITGSVTYTEMNPGREQGDALLGVVGRGAFSGTTRGLAAVVATSLVERVKGIPLAAALKGGTYVTRYDIDPAGTYRGLVLGTFKARELGSLCMSYVTTHGTFKAGAQFVPAKVTFKTIGGTGYAARVRANGTMSQTDVKGSETEQLFGNGLARSLTEGSPHPLSPACSALRALAR